MPSATDASPTIANASIRMWQALRSGKWLTPMRARAYSLILLVVFSLAMVGWIVSANGLVDRNGKPIGTDFSSFYAADGIRDVHLGRSPYAATIIRDSEGRAGLLWEGIV